MKKNAEHTVINTVRIMILMRRQYLFYGKITYDRSTSLCQQNVENIIPTYVHGTVIPEMSDLI
jgi:hypothetical protein